MGDAAACEAGRVPASINVLINELFSIPRRYFPVLRGFTRTVVLLHIDYSEEPFVAEANRLRWSTVDRQLGAVGVCGASTQASTWPALALAMRSH